MQKINRHTSGIILNRNTINGLKLLWDTNVKIAFPLEVDSLLPQQTLACKSKILLFAFKDEENVTDVGRAN